MSLSPGRVVGLAAVLAIAGLAAPAAAQEKGDPAALEEAKKHMKAGAAFYNDPPMGHKCEEALREFAKAFELSGSLNALKGMAICNLNLERDGDAIDQYTAYLAGKGGSLDAKEKAALEADLVALKAAVASVTISADKPGVRIRDVRTPATGSPIRNVYTVEAAEKKIAMHPGQHEITASLEGFPDQVWRVEIANGGTYSHAFSFQRAPEAPVTTKTRPVPTSVWVSTGLTGALGIAWGALAVRAKLKNDDYAKQNGRASASELESMRSSVKTANLVADVLLGATAAGLGTTLALYFTRPTVTSTSTPDQKKAASIYLAPVGGGVMIGGSF